MKEVKIKFKIEDIADELAMKRFFHGEDVCFALHEYLETLRQKLKHEPDTALIPGLEHAQDTLFRVLEEYSLDIDNLVR